MVSGKATELFFKPILQRKGTNILKCSKTALSGEIRKTTMALFPVRKTRPQPLARAVPAREQRPYLERQSDRVEATLAAHSAPVRVTGGTIGPRHIRFFLQLHPHVRFAAVKRLQDDLAITMNTPSLTIERGIDGVVLQFPNPEPHPVRLHHLVREYGTLPLGSAVLGVTVAGNPLHANLRAPATAHALVVGTTGSGKTALVRTMVASLLLTTRADLLGLAIIDPAHKILPRDFQSPRLVRPIVNDYAEACELLRSLVALMESRDKRGITVPSQTDPLIVVAIDEVADLIMHDQDRELEDALTRLAQRGRQALIHLIAATQHPSAAILGQLIRANFGLRLIGKVVSARDAANGAGVAGTNAHLLAGQGDFKVVASGQVTQFQAAFISRRDLHNLTQPANGPLTITLPSAPRPEQPAPAPDEMTLLVQRLAPWWAEHARDYGAKTEAVRVLFGDAAEAAGHNWRMTQRVIARIEKEAHLTKTSTST